MPVEWVAEWSPVGVPLAGDKKVQSVTPTLPDKVYTKNPDFVQREVAGECILVPVRPKLSDVSSLYVLNETGAAVWRRIDGNRSMSEILAELAAEFDVTREQLERDLASLLDDLLNIQAIKDTIP